MKCYIYDKKNWKTSQEIFQFIFKNLSTLVYNVLKWPTVTSSLIDGTKVVKLIPSTAVLYSSILGIRPKIADNTTTGVEANRDSPFYGQNLLLLFLGKDGWKLPNSVSFFRFFLVTHTKITTWTL